MNCPNCGANLKPGKKICEYCNSMIALDVLKQIEQVNKDGCPNCKSTNVSYNREKHGEIKHKYGMTVISRTMGICNDCGHTWNVNEDIEKTMDTLRNNQTYREWYKQSTKVDFKHACKVFSKAFVSIIICTAIFTFCCQYVQQCTLDHNIQLIKNNIKHIKNQIADSNSKIEEYDLDYIKKIAIGKLGMIEKSKVFYIKTHK